MYCIVLTVQAIDPRCFTDRVIVDNITVDMPCERALDHIACVSVLTPTDTVTRVYSQTTTNGVVWTISSVSLLTPTDTVTRVHMPSEISRENMN
jgi:hypothetical protein